MSLQCHIYRYKNHDYCNSLWTCSILDRSLNWANSATGEQPVPVWVTTQSTAILYYSANQPEWCRPIQMIQMVHY